MALPSHLVVEVDTREQRPLLFPSTISVRTGPRSRRVFSVHTVSRTIRDGDYRLSSHPSAGGIERKSGLTELSGNLLTKDRTRFTRAFNRLLDTYESPLLLIEGNPSELLGRSPRHPRAKPGEVADYVSALACRSRVPILWMPARTPAQKRKAGELALRWLIQAALIQDDAGG